MHCDLNKFLKAQAGDVYETALMEVRQGKAVGHWIWYIYPQMLGLGDSGMSKYYGIDGIDEAKAYLAEPTLGPRLLEATAALLEVEGRTAVQLFGKQDAAKVHSCMTLFDAARPGDVFDKVLAAYFDGQRCARTLELLHGTAPAAPAPSAPVPATQPSQPAATRRPVRKPSLWHRIKSLFH